MPEKRAVVTPARQSELESVQELLQLRGEQQLISTLTAISLSYVVALCLLYLPAILGSTSSYSGGPSAAALAIPCLLAAAHCWLLSSLSRKWFSRELHSRISLLRTAMVSSIDSSELLLALADPDFKPGQGWRPREDEHQDPARLFRLQESHSISQRVLGFLACPADYAKAFPSPLPGPEFASVKGDSLGVHIVLGLSILPAGIIASFASPLGSICVFFAVLVAFSLFVLNEAVLSAGAWKVALSTALADVLAPSRSAGSSSRRARPRRANPRLPAPALGPGAGRPSVPGADSPAAASPPARRGPQRESER